MSVSDIRAIEDFLFMLCSSIEFNPLMLVILVGDANIKTEHQRSCEIGNSLVGGLRHRGFGNPLFTGQRLGRRRSIMTTWIAVFDPMPTHLTSPRNPAPGLKESGPLGLATL